MVKIKETIGGSPKGTPKTKKTPKNKALTRLQSPKNQENRRKSLATVLPTPKQEKKAKDAKRKSIAAFPVPQFEEAAVKQDSNPENVEATPKKPKRKQSAAPNALETPRDKQNEDKIKRTPKSNKKKQINDESQNGDQPDPTPNSNKNKKTGNVVLSPKTTTRKQSLNNDVSLFENGTKEAQTPSKKKRHSSKHTPLVLAPKNDFLENEVKTQTPLKKKEQRPKKTPLVLAPKSESPVVESSENGLTQVQTLPKKLRQPSKQTPLVLAPKNEITKEKPLKKPKLDIVDHKFVLDIPELEKKHNVLVKDVKNAIEGVIKFASNNPKLQNQLFNAEIPLFLQINSFKIPNTKGPVKHVFRAPLEHSILTEESDICLIVPDVKGIPNKELEQHQEHYEKLLTDKGVKNIKKILTFYEFRTEYETFELKNRLADLYDIFLVDGRISGKVVHKAGQVFYKKRKVPNPVKLHVSKLADHIENTLKKVYFDMNCKSDSCMVQFGHSKMTTKELIDNVYSLVHFIDMKFPGKMQNIRSLNVYAHRGSSIPVYLSLKNPNEIKVPTMKHQKPKAYKSYTGELTTQYNAEVVVRPSGKVIVKRSKLAREEQTEENGDNEITDQDILTANKQEKEAKKQDSIKSKKRKISENGVIVKEENIKKEQDKRIKKEKNAVKVEQDIVKTEKNNNKKGKKEIVKKGNGVNINKTKKNKGKKANS